MSVAGIASSLYNYYAAQSSQSTQSTQNNNQFQQDFQQLGQDLQSGNLSAAQADFTTLQQLGSTTSTSSSSQSTSSNPIAQEFSQLSQDLQAGNTTAAEQDYSTIQQDFKNHASQGHHHHHHSSGSSSSDSSSSSSEMNTLSQLLDQLGDQLQSGNLASAQQAYSSLQQDFQLFSQTNGTTATTLPSASITA